MNATKILAAYFGKQPKKGLETVSSAGMVFLNGNYGFFEFSKSREVWYT